VCSIAYTTSSMVEMDVFEEPKGSMAWFQKPKTVRKKEEVLERVDRGDWRGSEIGERDLASGGCFFSSVSFWPIIIRNGYVYLLL
jgi:hypothetical protein